MRDRLVGTSLEEVPADAGCRSTTAGEHRGRQ
jgi:hypothetical protein